MRHIRDKFGNILYCIRDDGTITDKFDCNAVGHLKSDRITDKYNINTLYRIRTDGTITDKHDCDIIGHIREDGSITDKYDIHRRGSVDAPSSGNSNSSADTGCLGAIFSFLWAVVTFVFVVAIPFLFVYLIIPEYLGFTWVGFLCFIFGGLCASTGLLPLAFFFILIPTLVIQPLHYIYWILVIVVKIKTHCTKKAMLKLFWNWFLKGPFAFPALVLIMEENNIMPRFTKVLNNIIGFFRRIFAKK